MPIGTERILKLVKEQKLVENLGIRDLENPEGAGLDLRLGRVHKVVGETLLGVETRSTVDIELLAEYQEGKPQIFTFGPGESYLVTTFETVNLPQDLSGNLTMRSTLYRSGMVFSGGNVAPGYSGTLSFTFFNSGRSTIKVELGARVVHIQFEQVDGETRSYQGQWSQGGGRIAAPEEEKQI